MRDTGVALGCLVPYGSEMRRYGVNTGINQVENHAAECAKPVELEAPPQGRLFV